MTTPSENDLSLLRRVAGGEAEALREIYDLHGPRVMAVALKVLRSAPEAREVVQETFLEIWRRSPEYDPRRGSPLGWITGLARLRAIDRLEQPGLEVAPLAATPERQSNLPLSNEQRRALELAYFEGLSQTEIARKTGVSVDAVKAALKSGMDELASALGALGGARGP